MKKSLKLCSLILAVLMFTGIFTACSSDEQKVSTDDTYTYWVHLDGNVSRTSTTLNGHYMYEAMEKATGTKVEFIHPAQGSTGSEAFQILLASGDYPDMIEYSWSEYAGGGDQAIKDGVIIALNEYMKDYAPNYYNYMEGEAAKENNYKYKAAAISNEGNYYGFKNLNVGNYRAYNGLFVRKDLLDKWGLDIPTTIDEWEIVLKTAKENGIKYPLTGNSMLVGVYGYNYFNTPYKVHNEFYLKDGKVAFGPFQDGYKDYVAKMADWVKKGYIDIDYVTNDSTITRGNICNGISIASTGFVGGDLGYIIPAMKERDPEFKLAACPIPAMNKGETPIFQGLQDAAVDPTTVISKQCGENNEDRYKKAISWCDYLFSDEGIVLKSFGIEGDTFTIEKDENGVEHYTYTDKIIDWENSDISGVTSLNDALYHYVIPANHPGFNQHPDYFRGYYQYDEQKDAIEVWNKYAKEAEANVLPTLAFTTEEAEKKANIESRGKDNLTAAISNIILGKASIDTFESVIEDAKKAGFEELTGIYQDAYNRYLENLK